METTLRVPPLVVGVDGTDSSSPALAWAIEEAAVRRLPIHLVSAWHSEYELESLGASRDTVLEHCQAILDAARTEVAVADPTLVMSMAAQLGPASRALVDASREADTVVVGSRGHRTIPAALLGATSLDVAAHAYCPVVVVPKGSNATSQRGRVVVGVDGSAVSANAIEYAFAHASQRMVGLTVVHAWQTEYVAGVISGLAAEDTTTRVSAEEAALTAESIAGWRDKFPDVDLQTSVVNAHPVDALVSESQAADLVVLGSHGRGALAGTILGSVAHGVLHRSHCPVAVVRPHRSSGGHRA